MCGGPPGSQTKITDVSESAAPPGAACARVRNKSANPMLVNPNAPACRKLRRETGPGQCMVEWFIKRACQGSNQSFVCLQLLFALLLIPHHRQFLSLQDRVAAGSRQRALMRFLRFGRTTRIARIIHARSRERVGCVEPL